MSDRKLLVDLKGTIVGSTHTQQADGIFRATCHTTGEDWGLVVVRSLDWPRRRVYAHDLEPLDIVPLDKSL
ncbi:MAG: hypothetical protein WC455_13505 [Dehalococcoidia bacterium]|jgi:hypothetical protein